jgi:hypothetical protein
MTSRSLISLILKISGLFFIKDILDALSRSISVLIYFPQYASRQEAIYNLAATIPALVLYTFFVVMLLFGTNLIIRMLRLDKGVQAELLPVGLQRSEILNIGIIVAGGWLLVSGLLEFVRTAFYYYQERKLYGRMVRPDLSYMVMAIARLLIGFMLIGFHRLVVSLIETKQGGQTSWYWPMRMPFVKKSKKKVG